MTPPSKICAEELATARSLALKLLHYCEARDWAGYDPYDALNSRWFQILPVLNRYLFRLVFTQTLKRSPLNLRPLLLVPETQNPKGLALFLSAAVKLARAGVLGNGATIDALADQLVALRSPESRHFSWGYSFDWQTRIKLVPKGSPNIICTTFAANALLDVYEHTAAARCLEQAQSAGAFILETLYQQESDSAWFNYTVVEPAQIHNANLLGAALLCRIAQTTGDQAMLDAGLRATRFSVARQNKDGSWYYGERDRPSQKWIDNFHTGYNLCALRNIARFARTDEFNPSLMSGLDYYVTNFFEPNGAPKYFHNRTYPLDVHSAAQSIIALHELRDLRPGNVKLASKVLGWTLANLWNPAGFFEYQKHRFWTNRLSYLRWGQAWMLLALSTVVESCSETLCTWNLRPQSQGVGV